MAYRAVVIGATGAVGSSLVRELIASPLYERITALVRQESAHDLFDDPASKLNVHVVAMEHLGTEAIAAARNCQAAFCTMGVGQPRKVPKEHFWKVDVEYTVSFARACKIAGAKHFSLLSSVGADVNSRSNYLQVKGIVEERVAALGFSRVSVFRPSLLVTKEIRYGLQDRITQSLFPLISNFLAPRFRQIKVENLGRAMRVNAEQAEVPGVEYLCYPEFQNLLALQAGKTQTAQAR